MARLLAHHGVEIFQGEAEIVAENLMKHPKAVDFYDEGRAALSFPEQALSPIDYSR